MARRLRPSRYIPINLLHSRWYITDIHRLDMVHILYIMLRCISVIYHLPFPQQHGIIGRSTPVASASHFTIIMQKCHHYEFPAVIVIMSCSIYRARSSSHLPLLSSLFFQLRVRRGSKLLNDASKGTATMIHPNFKCPRI